LKATVSKRNKPKKKSFFTGRGDVVKKRGRGCNAAGLGRVENLEFKKEGSFAKADSGAQLETTGDGWNLNSSNGKARGLDAIRGAGGRSVKN